MCAYKISEGSETPKQAWLNIKEKYPHLDANKFRQKTPAVLCYSKIDGKIKNMGDDWNLHGGISSVDFLKKKIIAYTKYIPSGMTN